MKTPDGYYVDCDGRRCEKNEVELSSFKKTLNSMISQMPGEWSVYVKDLSNNNELVINNHGMSPASVIKLAVMEATYDAIKNKKLEKTSYVNSLLKSMITVSDNESYNALVRLQSPSRNFLDGASRINKYLKKKGYTNTEIHSSLHPSSSPVTYNGSNVMTVKDVGLLLERIEKGTNVSSKYSLEMKNLLLSQTRRWKIPMSLPSGIRCGNKTGETSSTQNDVAIVYGRKTTYVVCIFSKCSEYYGVNGIQKLSRTIYDHLNK